jgi:hypothetical protein
MGKIQVTRGDKNASMALSGSERRDKTPQLCIFLMAIMTTIRLSRQQMLFE